MAGVVLDDAQLDVVSRFEGREDHQLELLEDRVGGAFVECARHKLLAVSARLCEGDQEDVLSREIIQAGDHVLSVLERSVLSSGSWSQMRCRQELAKVHGRWEKGHFRGQDRDSAREMHVFFLGRS